MSRPPGMRTAAGEASPLQYSARFGPRALRPMIGALYALVDEIQETTIRSSTAEIRTLRLAFWRSELDGIQKGEARHPLTQSLARLLPRESRRHPLFQAMVDSAYDEATLTDVHAPEPFLALLRQEVAAPVCLVGELAGGHDARSQAFCEAIGLGWALTQRLQAIGLTYRHHPHELKRLAALPAATPHNPGDATRLLEAAIRGTQETAHSYYAQARALWPTVRSPRLRSPLVLWRLGEALLAELSHNDGELLRAEIHLPRARMHRIALRCLFIV